MPIRRIAIDPDLLQRGRDEHGRDLASATRAELATCAPDRDHAEGGARFVLRLRDEALAIVKERAAVHACSDAAIIRGAIAASIDTEDTP